MARVEHAEKAGGKRRARLTKAERQALLLRVLEEDPLCTDEELARRFGVSVQTIRLDRLELGLPEMRVRAKELAARAHDRLRSIQLSEVVGELVDVELGRSGVSILQTSEAMGFAKSGIVRGHHLFAQGNSLAVAIIDAEMALTASARLRFIKPVRVGDRVVAKALVAGRRGNKSLVEVRSRIDDEEVFNGRFVVAAVSGE